MSCIGKVSGSLQALCAKIGPFPLSPNLMAATRVALEAVALICWADGLSDHLKHKKNLGISLESLQGSSFRSQAAIIRVSLLPLHNTMSSWPVVDLTGILHNEDSQEQKWAEGLCQALVIQGGINDWHLIISSLSSLQEQ